MGVMTVQYGYGVRTSDISNYKTDQLKKLIETRFPDIYKDMVEELGEELTSEDIVNWSFDYEGSHGGNGIPAMLADIIVEDTGINIYGADDDNGNDYLLIWDNSPWNFNEKTKQLSEEEFCSIIRKYINMVTDETLEIKDWSLEYWN